MHVTCSFILCYPYRAPSHNHDINQHVQNTLASYYKKSLRVSALKCHNQWGRSIKRNVDPTHQSGHYVAFTEMVTILNITILKYTKLITIYAQCCNIYSIKNVNSLRMCFVEFSLLVELLSSHLCLLKRQLCACFLLNMYKLAEFQHQNFTAMKTMPLTASGVMACTGGWRHVCHKASVLSDVIKGTPCICSFLFLSPISKKKGNLLLKAWKMLSKHVQKINDSHFN